MREKGMYLCVWRQDFVLYVLLSSMQDHIYMSFVLSMFLMYIDVVCVSTWEWECVRVCQCVWIHVYVCVHKHEHTRLTGALLVRV